MTSQGKPGQEMDQSTNVQWGQAESAFRDLGIVSRLGCIYDVYFITIEGGINYSYLFQYTLSTYPPSLQGSYLPNNVINFCKLTHPPIPQLTLLCL
jgi:hypothetical protein